MQPLYDKVITYIRTNGPSLPIQIAKVMEKDTFYAGAILSDLLAKKMLRITTAKIGGSPLYYLPEQEAQHSKLYAHLPMREKEAYSFLKERKVLKDNELQPAIRFALQMLKDFAVPFEHKNERMWRWHLTSEQEAQNIVSPPQLVIQQQVMQPISQQQVQQTLQKPSKQTIPDAFTESIHHYLKAHNLVITEHLSQRKNKELIATVSVPSALGALEMLLVAKNKKKITNNDLSLAHQKGQVKKLTTIFLTTGEIGKKSEQHIEKNLKGLLLFRKL